VSISCLPLDLHYIFKDLTLSDTFNCMYVCKEWNVFFNQDTLWEKFAIQYKVNEKTFKFKAVHKTLLTQETLLRKRVSKQFSRAFSILFEKHALFQRFPVIVLNREDMLWEKSGTGFFAPNATRYFPDKCFSAPIVIVMVKVVANYFYATGFLLLSFTDVKSKQVFRIALNFDENSKGNLFINLDWNPSEMKSAFEKLSGFSVLNSKPQFELLRNIIAGKHQLKLC
jgi:hypothetical protein